MPIQVNQVTSGIQKSVSLSMHC